MDQLNLNSQNRKHCSIHPNQQITFIRLDKEEDKDILKCNLCIYEQKINCIPLDLIDNSDFKTILKGWPIQQDSQIYSKLLEFTKIRPLVEENRNKVCEYFKSLQLIINQLLELKKKEMLKNVEQHQINFDQSLNYCLLQYNIISQKEKLKEIIQTQYGNQETQNKMLFEIIRQNNKYEQQNKKYLENLINNVEQQFVVCLDSHNLIKQQIISLISNLDTFQVNININQDISELVVKEIIDLQRCSSNVKKVVIDFKEKDINSDVFTNVSNKLVENKNLSSLDMNFSKNRIKIDYVRNLMDVMVYNSLSIQNMSLNLSYCNLSSEMISILSEGLASLKNLENLQVELKHSRVSNQGANLIARALSQLQKIKKLNLDFGSDEKNPNTENSNKIQKEGVQNICEAINKFQNLTCLTLDLAKNTIGIEGVEIISKKLLGLQNLTELNLNLWQNQIQDGGVKIITDALKNNKNVKKLDLNLRKNQIQIEGARCISNLFLNNQYITSLNLNLQANPSIGSLGLSSITNALGSCFNLNSLSLNLNFNNIGDKGCQEIANAIEKLKGISNLSLQLYKNSIGKEGLLFIAKSIQKNQTITNLTLNLGENIMGDEKTNTFAKALQDCKHIRSLNLDLRKNQINAIGVKEIANLIEQSINITEFQLQMISNQIGNEGIIYISNALKKNKNILILNLDLWNNKINEKGVKDITITLSDSRSINQLQLDLRNIEIQSEESVALLKKLEISKNWSHISVQYDLADEKYYQDF
ncbi:hypothetical protein TTHERM_01243420 (macronuclear) [Tetrahymena thermophila SB210]|uniref:Kinase domain protein n=1 Tax=Tetrahymena thermophila (strain SB210) TaxID=312017 RepID=Q24BT0_TETTS|nr:hypothetical protein TTHERM_01243420 [Tetrahymena thermophila SB210]EAS05228.2 hypothetical protein TTHERM_01243420 [Tetrahymena thermophila SB210]|eukprot:XP_001025473.2 hypothetical protein TTHERM_01243420 [Tetrahymena thermophila SB210]